MVMRWSLLAVPVLAVLVGTAAFSQQDILLPDWVRNSASWWAQGSISDAEFVTAIEWMIDNKIIRLGGDDKIIRETYTMSYPIGWERQVPIRGDDGAISDGFVVIDTIDEPIPAKISISTTPMHADTLEEYRERGLEMITEFLGDAFTHTRTAPQMVAGQSGYVDEYVLEVFAFTVQGKSYSFEYMGQVHEIKYESDPKHYDKYLPEFERIYDTFQLR